ncbi:MAG: HEPN domain-containing protein [Planctomycetes bacterium]|nr:HEPN domain-containing protein [Planctomycetota bacterium]MCG2683624.1 HEPN domain-containing protein [Planctomycetales bacterium]
MSQSSDLHEARRWLDTAGEDLRAARALVEAGFHAHACFSAQQCAEKSVKAAWHLIGAAPWGHSVQRLVEEFPMKNHLDGADDLIEKARALDRLYVPTRYPNGLPDLTPGKNYSTADSRQAIDFADHFLTVFGSWMET